MCVYTSSCDPWSRWVNPHNPCHFGLFLTTLRPSSTSSSVAMAHPSCHRTVAHHAIIHHFVVHRSIIIGRTGVVKKQPDVSQCSRTRVFTFFHLTRDTVAIMLASTLQNIAANQRSSTSSKDSEMESKASCSASPSACRVCCIVRVFVCGLACRLKHLRPNSRRMHCCVPPHGLPRGKEHRAVPDGQQSIRSTP